MTTSFNPENRSDAFSDGQNPTGTLIKRNQNNADKRGVSDTTDDSQATSSHTETHTITNQEQFGGFDSGSSSQGGSDSPVLKRNKPTATETHSARINGFVASRSPSGLPTNGFYG